MMKYMQWMSPLGQLYLAASGRGLAGVYFEQHRHFKGLQDWQQTTADSLLLDTAAQLQDYFAGSLQEFTIPLDLSAGTPFQQAVWYELLRIPYGRTCSYGELANALGKPQAVRAVGAANGRNPVSVIVPCHRVIAASGALTGYAGGLKNKQALLKLEAEKDGFSENFLI
ncbi:methylated-DNA--[protein]-cysteine S-methyltransferase [Undibacterium griseum]|uniref:Methylated-DNA--protein-cysteine methyltransferase n=1 Tax=Undibacterium griseum TaxID=2762295 RepID=A0ABR6YID1_9BURK|nr:methylated-DNA--[protein]-cysteine S-methyltransferase [Undibacterium griseum]MBC3883656.1 methylated-DNA--[protein]-cysteine S-methyltransferase [Undibacterium griseum]